MPVWVKFEAEPNGTYVIYAAEWKGPNKHFVGLLQSYTRLEWYPSPGDTHKPDRWIADKAIGLFGGTVMKDTEKGASKPGRIYGPE